MEVLTPTTRDPWYKLAVFVPAGYEDRVRQSLGTPVWGSSAAIPIVPSPPRGRARIVPSRGRSPSAAEMGQALPAEEFRLEILAPESLLPAALTRLQEIHPYY